MDSDLWCRVGRQNHGDLCGGSRTDQLYHGLKCPVGTDPERSVRQRSRAELDVVGTSASRSEPQCGNTERLAIHGQGIRWQRIRGETDFDSTGGRESLILIDISWT